MQKFFYVCVLLVHFHISLIYLYWGRLCSDPVRMQYLNMFFIKDTKEFCRYYDLELELARKFVRKVKYYKTFMYVLLYGFIIFFFALTIRCLVLSYMTIPFEYFLLIACPNALIDLFGYVWLSYSFLVNLLMATLTMEFLILRATCASNKLKKELGRFTKYAPQSNRSMMLKRRKDIFRIAQTVNDIVRQFSVSLLNKLVRCRLMLESLGRFGLKTTPKLLPCWSLSVR